jgi:hypothetical protein
VSKFESTATDDRDTRQLKYIMAVLGFRQLAKPAMMRIPDPGDGVAGVFVEHGIETGVHHGW